MGFAGSSRGLFMIYGALIFSICSFGHICIVEIGIGGIRQDLSWKTVVKLVVRYGILSVGGRRVFVIISYRWR